MIELCRTDYHFDNWITMQWIIADKIILIFCIIAFISTIQNNVRSAKIDKNEKCRKPSGHAALFSKYTFCSNYQQYSKRPNSLSITSSFLSDASQ